MRFTQNKGWLLTATIAASILSACGGSSSDTPVVHPSSLAAVSSPDLGTAQTANAAVDNFVQGMMKEGEIPGLSLAVVENGKLIYSKAYGYANLARATPVTTEHTFLMGSITKSIAAVAVLTNQGYSGREPQRISRKVAQLFRPGLPYCCDPK